MCVLTPGSEPGGDRNRLAPSAGPLPNTNTQGHSAGAAALLSSSLLAAFLAASRYPRFLGPTAGLARLLCPDPGNERSGAEEGVFTHPATLRPSSLTAEPACGGTGFVAPPALDGPFFMYCCFLPNGSTSCFFSLKMKVRPPPRPQTVCSSILPKSNLEKKGLWQKKGIQKKNPSDLKLLLVQEPISFLAPTDWTRLLLRSRRWKQEERSSGSEPAGVSAFGEKHPFTSPQQSDGG